MRITYTRSDGSRAALVLGQQPVTIGRSPEADIVLQDDKASRLHCGIRWWDNAFFLRDLKSKNGTFVNEVRIDVHRLAAGDHIRARAAVLTVEEDADSVGPDTAVHEMEEEMSTGKGYGTILREIVKSVEHPKKGTPPPEKTAE